MKYIVSVIKKSDDCCVKSFKRDSLQSSKKLKRGLEINLNHAEYYVKIIHIYI